MENQLTAARPLTPIEVRTAIRMAALSPLGISARMCQQHQNISEVEVPTSALVRAAFRASVPLGIERAAICNHINQRLNPGDGGLSA